MAGVLTNVYGPHDPRDKVYFYQIPQKHSRVDEGETLDIRGRHQPHNIIGGKKRREEKVGGIM